MTTADGSTQDGSVLRIPLSAFNDLVAQSLDDVTPESALEKIVRVARQTIGGADDVSITMLKDGSPSTVAFTGQLAMDLDESQYERGYGPCLDAAVGSGICKIDDMRTEQRWPEYVAHVVQTTPVRSSLSVPLPYQGSSIGALNNYSTRPAAFASPESLQAGLEVAEAVAVAVANADAHHQLSEQARNMRVAMESRAVIEQAKGVLMAQRHVDAEQAFEILREASQRYNRKLRDIAVGIVESTREAVRRP